jgi:hypothetical protein
MRMSAQLRGHFRVPSLYLGCLLALVALVLGGCLDQGTDAYVFGFHKSCYSGKKPLAECERIELTATMRFRVLAEQQEVTFLYQSLGAKAEDTIFRRVHQCEVIDSDNFSCPGLIRRDGLFLQAQMLNAVIVTTSYPAYLLSKVFTPTQKLVEFMDAHKTAVNVVIGVLVLFAFIAINVA